MDDAPDDDAPADEAPYRAPDEVPEQLDNEEDYVDNKPDSVGDEAAGKFLLRKSRMQSQVSSIPFTSFP